MHGDGALGDVFGSDPKLVGDTLFLGAWADDNYAGSLYIFMRTGGTWSEQSKLVPCDRDSEVYFGTPAAVEGDILAIAANGDDDNG